MSNLSSFPTEEPKTTKQKILEAGANLLQSKEPIKSYKQHLISLSHIAGDPNKQFILHHFVNAFNEDFAQALLYDGDVVDSKLVGIQYIISDKVYLTLPEEEKKLWNPLHYMVKNGLLLAPSLPTLAEKPLMTRLLTSFSKTFLFWETALNPLPLGIPQILSSFTADGQANKTMSTNLLEAAEIKLAELIKRRENIDQNPPLINTANHSQGDIYQLFLQRVGGQQNLNQMGAGFGNTPLTGVNQGLTGTTGFGNTPLTGANQGLTGTTGFGNTPLTGANQGYGTSSPLTGTSGLTGVNSNQIGQFGGEHGYKRDVNTTLPGSSTFSSPYHNTSSSDYTAQ